MYSLTKYKMCTNGISAEGGRNIGKVALTLAGKRGVGGGGEQSLCEQQSQLKPSKGGTSLLESSLALCPPLPHPSCMAWVNTTSDSSHSRASCGGTPVDMGFVSDRRG